MRTKKPLTMHEHTAIAWWVSPVTTLSNATLISGAYGASSRASKMAWAIHKKASALRCEMEQMARNDGHGVGGANLYFPPSGN